MKEDWKREQSLVLQLENDIIFKESLLQDASEVKLAQKNQIDKLNYDLNTLNANMSDLNTKKSTTESRNINNLQDQLNDGTLQRQELERLLLERQEELDECKEELFSMKQGLEEIIEENRNMYQDLNMAQRVIEEKDQKITEQDLLILTLGEEVKEKKVLQAKLNEREVKEELKRQNLDVSIS